MGTPRHGMLDTTSKGRRQAGEDDDSEGPARETPAEASRVVLALPGIPMAGITRRRAAWVLGAVVTVWIVAVFARQVSDATAASVRADRMRAANQALAAQVAGLQRERDLIQRQEYIELAARGYGLGSAKERPFSIADDAPPLPSDAPGSAAVRLGVRHEVRSPLDSWLTLLFGPAPGS